MFPAEWDPWQDMGQTLSLKGEGTHTITQSALWFLTGPANRMISPDTKGTSRCAGILCYYNNAKRSLHRGNCSGLAGRIWVTDSFNWAKSLIYLSDILHFSICLGLTFKLPHWSDALPRMLLERRFLFVRNISSCRRCGIDSLRPPPADLLSQTTVQNSCRTATTRTQARLTWLIFKLRKHGAGLREEMIWWIRQLSHLGFHFNMCRLSMPLPPFSFEWAEQCLVRWAYLLKHL